jgi:hypothetical protein
MPNAHSVSFATTATALGSGDATDILDFGGRRSWRCYGFLTAPSIGSHYTGSHYTGSHYTGLCRKAPTTRLHFDMQMTLTNGGNRTRQRTHVFTFSDSANLYSPLLDVEL